MRICKLSLYGCKDVSELEEEDDMQPTKACTSTLQLWHRKSRGDAIYPQPVMEISVKKKTKLDDSSQSSKEPGLNCLLYEARNNLRTQFDELNSKRNFSRLILQLILQCHVFYMKKSPSLKIRVCCLPGLTNP